MIASAYTQKPLSRHVEIELIDHGEAATDWIEIVDTGAAATPFEFLIKIPELSDEQLPPGSSINVYTDASPDKKEKLSERLCVIAGSSFPSPQKILTVAVTATAPRFIRFRVAVIHASSLAGTSVVVYY